MSECQEHQRVLVTIATLLVSLATSISGEICCCPDLTVSLKCEDKSLATKPSVKSSVLKANGYVCDALEGSDVTLRCDLTDKNHPAVQSVRYSYHKAYMLNYKYPVPFDPETATVSSCEDEATCTLSAVRWSGSGVFSQTQFMGHDDYLYSCMVRVTLQDGAVVTLTSNSMWLDVYKNIPAPSPVSSTVTDVPPVDTGNYYTRLECGNHGNTFPQTNPRSRAVWSFKKTEQHPWRTLNVLAYPRFALIEPEIATNALGSFREGTLVIMLFDPLTDTGLYKCSVVYETDTVGESQEYEMVTYRVSASNNQYEGGYENKMLSTVTSARYTEIDGSVDFSCYARDVDASVPGTFRWVYEKDSQWVPVDTESEPLFAGARILYDGKTLRLPSQYRYYGMKFRCEVMRDGVTIRSKVFRQPVIVPRQLYIPITTKQCINPGENIDIQSSVEYMLSEKIVQPAGQYVQKLTGATHRWRVDEKQISPLVNDINGGVTTETRLKITPDVLDVHYTGSFINQKCRYFSLTQTVTTDRGYQVSEVLKVTRPPASTCQDLSQRTCNAMKIAGTCDEVGNDGNITREGSIVVTLDKQTPQCLSVTVRSEGERSVTRQWDSVAPSCAGRAMEMTITRSALQQSTLSGVYTVELKPEGRTGCSRTFDYDSEADCNPTNAPEPVVTACPAQYSVGGAPWTVNASAACALRASQLRHLDLSPSSGGCREVVMVNKKTTSRRNTKICDVESELGLELEDSVEYELLWDMAATGDQCIALIKVSCNGSERQLATGIFLLLPPLLLVSLH